MKVFTGASTVDFDIVSSFRGFAIYMLYFVMMPLRCSNTTSFQSVTIDVELVFCAVTFIAAALGTVEENTLHLHGRDKA